MLRFAPAAIAALLLCACGGGGGSSSDGSGSSGGGSGGSSGGGFSVRCSGINGGGATTSTRSDASCHGCSSADGAKAADGNLDSFARLSVGQSLPTTGVSLRATAQPGIVYAAGSRPGAYTHVPNNSSAYSVTINSFLAGAQQESVTTDSSNNDSDSLTYFGLVSPTTKPFDAVELLFSNQHPVPTEIATLQVLEICSDGGVVLP